MSDKKYRPLCAADILKKSHELYKSLVEFCGDKDITKRQARKFLQKYPQYREVMVEI